MIGTLHQIQSINLIIAGMGVGSYLIWAIRNPIRWRYAVAPFVYCVHVALFYSFVLIRDSLGLFAGVDFTLWSSIRALHGLFTITGAGIVLALEYIEIRPNRTK